MKSKKIWLLPAISASLITLPMALAASCGSDSSSDSGSNTNKDTNTALPQSFQWNSITFKNGDEVKGWAEKNTQKVKIKRDQNGGDQYWDLYAKNIRIGFIDPADARNFVTENNVVIKQAYFSQETIDPKSANGAVELTNDSFKFVVVKPGYPLTDKPSAVVEIFEGANGKLFLTEASARASFTGGSHDYISSRFVLKEDATKYNFVNKVPYLLEGKAISSTKTPTPSDIYEATSFEGKKLIFTDYGNEVPWLLEQNKFHKLIANDGDTWFELSYRFSNKQSAGKVIKLHFWSIDDLVDFVVNFAKK